MHSFVFLFRTFAADSDSPRISLAAMYELVAQLLRDYLPAGLTRARM
jgi:hypothetical protein